MEIVHLVSSGGLGGTESSVLEMIGSVRDAHPSWTLRAVAPEDGLFVERLVAAGIPVEVMPFPPTLARLGEAGLPESRAGRAQLAATLIAAAPGALAYARRLRAATSGADVIHAHGFKMQVLSAVSRRSRTRLVWHLHDYVGTRPASGRLLRALSGRCAVAIANSRSVAADARTTCGDGIEIATMFNAVNLARFHPRGDRLDLDAMGSASEPAAGTLKIGLVATFARWKGHATFLEALSRLPAALPVRGYVIGGAAYQTAASQYSEGALRELASGWNLGDRVVFTGAAERADAAIRALDIVVHASTRPEPFGMVIAEAMACGRPVVISRAGGAAELVQDEVDGISHVPGDAGSLADAIVRLASAPELRARLGVAARASAERLFDRSRLASDLAPFYTGRAA